MPQIRVPYYFETFILRLILCAILIPFSFIHIYQEYTSQLRLAFFLSYELTYFLYY